MSNETPKLRQIKVALGYDCNRDCGFCLQLRKDKSPKLDFPLVEKVMSEEMVHADVQRIIITGGEPTYGEYRDTALKIVEAASWDSKETCVFTNGDFLHSDVIEEFKHAGLTRFRVSLYDPIDWGRMANLMENLEAHGFPRMAKYTVTKENYSDLEHVLNEVPKAGIKWFQIKPYNRVEVPEVDAKYELEPEQVLRVAKWSLLFRDSNPEIKVDLLPLCYEFLVDDSLGVEDLSHCNCGQGECGYLVICPNGDVKICGAYPKPLGNVKTDSLTELWKYHPLLRKVRNRTQPEECGKCGNWDKCSKTDCHSATFAKYGNFDHANPQCPLAKKEQTI